MLLSWDVGVKNLAYCLANNDGTILKWDIIDLSNKKHFTCNGIKKSGSQCDSKSSCYDKTSKKFYCKTHSKTLETKPIYICFDCNSKATKICCSSQEFYCKKCLSKKDNIDSFEELIINKNVTKTSLVKLAQSLIDKLDKIPELLNAKTIDIENQPCLKNPTMKSIQMILYSYFIIRNKDKKQSISINLVSAKNKLKFSIDTEKINEIKQLKNKYQQNKKLAIEYTREFLKENQDWLEYFETFKNKKDDLADSYLMIRHRMKTI